MKAIHSQPIQRLARIADMLVFAMFDGQRGLYIWQDAIQKAPGEFRDCSLVVWHPDYLIHKHPKEVATWPALLHDLCEDYGPDGVVAFPIRVEPNDPLGPLVFDPRPLDTFPFSYAPPLDGVIYIGNIWSGKPRIPLDQLAQKCGEAIAAYNAYLRGEVYAFSATKVQEGQEVEVETGTGYCGLRQVFQAIPWQWADLVESVAQTWGALKERRDNQDETSSPPDEDPLDEDVGGVQLCPECERPMPSWYRGRCARCEQGE